MPIYEYRCSGGHEYERWEGFAAPTEHTCPYCGRPARRRLSVPTVIFKGPGFYSTDNRKGWTSGGNGGSKTKASQEQAPSQESGSDVTAEAKSDIKSEATE